MLDLTTPCAVESMMVGDSSMQAIDTAFGQKTLDDHLTLLMRRPELQMTSDQPISPNQTQLRIIEPGEAWRCRGDFIMLLRTLGAPPQDDWINVRINGWTDSAQYDGLQTHIYLIGAELYNIVQQQIAMGLRTRTAITSGLKSLR